MSEKFLMKGNDAIAEAAIRAGLDCYFGYPITPQNEIPEYMSAHLPARGGTFIQAESELAADGIFIYIGDIPNTQFLGGQLELDKRGYIATDRLTHTSVEGVFAAGDVQEPHLRQIATAVGSGARAAFEAERFIAGLEGRAYGEWKSG